MIGLLEGMRAEVSFPYRGSGVAVSSISDAGIGFLDVNLRVVSSFYSAALVMTEG